MKRFAAAGLLVLAACSGGNGEGDADGDAAPARSYESMANAACSVAADEFEQSLDRFPTSFPPVGSEWAAYLDEYKAIIDRVLVKVDVADATPAAKVWIATVRRGQDLVDRARGQAAEGRWSEMEATMGEREALARGEMADTARAAGLDTCAEGVTRAASRG